MKGDRVEVTVDIGIGVRISEIEAASKAGRKVEDSILGGVIGVNVNHAQDESET